MRKIQAAIAMTILLVLSLVPTAVRAQYNNGQSEPGNAIYAEVVDDMYVVDAGVVYSVRTKQYVTPAQANSQMSGMVVAVVVGGVGGAGAVYLTNGPSAGPIIVGAVFGGLGGAFGAVAAVTTGVVRILTGTIAVADQMVGARVVQQMGPPGSVGSNVPCNGGDCFLVKPPVGADW